MIDRSLFLKTHKSTILLGPRLTGKSSLLRSLLKDSPHWYVDLLHLKNRNRYASTPDAFREEALFQIQSKKIKTFYIDEIQKAPLLLDEIHSLIEEFKITVFLSGSSPRKLKRGEANLLGGRVPIRHLMPFTTAELKEHFNLEQALQFGLLPGIYFSEKEDFKPKLVTYVDSYLKEEIAAEGIIRKLEPFSRFLEVAGIYAGQSLNFSNISRESSVPLKTVQNYFQILEDTMITFILPAWDKNIKKQLAITPKFYFFDSGITNVLTNHLDEAIDAQQKGHLFEQFIVNECRACKSYQLSLKKLFFWRTQTNNEVDLILANGRKIEAAIEIKYKHELTQKDFSGLDVFHEEHPDTPRYLIYLGDTKAKKQGVHIYNYRQFILDIMPGLL